MIFHVYDPFPGENGCTTWLYNLYNLYNQDDLYNLYNQVIQLIQPSCIIQPKFLFFLFHEKQNKIFLVVQPGCISCITWLYRLYQSSWLYKLYNQLYNHFRLGYRVLDEFNDFLYYMFQDQDQTKYIIKFQKKMSQRGA